MSDQPFLTQTKEGVRLAVRLSPKASKNKIGSVHAKQLKIYVTAPPVDGKANAALIALLAAHLKRPKSSLSIIDGEQSRQKVVLIEDARLAEIALFF